MRSVTIKELRREVNNALDGERAFLGGLTHRPNAAVNPEVAHARGRIAALEAVQVAIERADASRISAL